MGGEAAGETDRVVGCFRHNDLFIIPENGQEFFDIVNRNVLLLQPFQQVGHRWAHVNKVADEATGPCQHQRFAEFFKGSPFLALSIKDQCPQGQ